MFLCSNNHCKKERKNGRKEKNTQSKNFDLFHKHWVVPSWTLSGFVIPDETAEKVPKETAKWADSESEDQSKERWVWLVCGISDTVISLIHANRKERTLQMIVCRSVRGEEHGVLMH